MLRYHLKQHGWAVAIATLVAACGSDNSDMGGSAPAPSAGTTATAGKTGTTAGKGATTATAGRGTGTTTTPTAGKTGSTTNPSTGTAGHSGSGAAGASARDEDAGVPTAGSHAAGSGGAGAHAGSGGSTGAAAGSGGGSAAAASFTEVYALLMTSCAGSTCHVGAMRPAAGLDMKDKATAYMNLVDASSTQCMGEKRVVASDPDKSELVHSLQHTNIGSCTRTPKMPDNKPMFTSAQLDTVINWVKAGAPNN